MFFEKQLRTAKKNENTAVQSKFLERGRKNDREGRIDKTVSGSHPPTTKSPSRSPPPEFDRPINSRQTVAVCIYHARNTKDERFGTWIGGSAGGLRARDPWNEAPRLDKKA